MKKTVYNVKTGKKVEVEAIDAQEYIKTGGWSAEPVDIKKEPEIVTPKVVIKEEDIELMPIKKTKK